jgi:hypothetical protein
MAEGESKGRKARPYWLPFLIALVMFIALNIFYFRPELVERTMFSFRTWVTIGYLVIVVMLAWLFIWKITLNTEVASGPEPEEPRPKKAKPTASKAMEADEEEAPKKKTTKARPKRVVVATGAAAGATAGKEVRDEPPEGLHRPDDVIETDIEDLPRVIEYPAKEPGGVYSDTLVKVDTSLVLNLRILLGKVCHNCEELDDCKRRVEGKVDEDIFLYNFECKDGLKKELHKARKKREKEKAKAAIAKEMVEEKAADTKVEEKAKKKPAKKKPTTKKKSSKKKTSSKVKKKEEN